jgi:streptogrisin C
MAVLVAATAATTSGATTPEGGTPVVHPSGIVILEESDPDADPIPEAAAAALSEAMQQSSRDPEDFAYPFYDPAKRTVVLSPASARGRAQVGAARLAASKAAATTGEQVTVEQRAARVSRTRIDAAMDDLIGRQREGVTIIDAYPDPINSRLIVEVSALDDAFLFRAARTHGSDVLAVRLSRDAEIIGSPAVGREADNSPFYGGAHIDPRGCTSGFAWHSGSTEMMLTAGHCYPTGGSISTPTSSMGRVSSGTEENWTSGTGTVLMTGETTNRGDLAMIRISSGQSSSSRIYRGGPGSTTAANVSGKWSRSPSQGDEYCTGGRVAGEVCGWKVKWAAAGNHFYNGSNETARRVWRGEKRGDCIQGGDSGGPVYTVNSSGAVAAKGIISGVNGYGGSDH